MTTKVSNTSGLIDEGGKSQGSLADILTGLVDFSTFKFFLREFWKEQIYPFRTTSLKIVSFKEPMKYFIIVTHFINFKVLFFFVISSVVSTVILKYILEQSVSLAALEFVRMLASASTLKGPTKL